MLQDSILKKPAVTQDSTLLEINQLQVQYGKDVVLDIRTPICIKKGTGSALSGQTAPEKAH